MSLLTPCRFCRFAFDQEHLGKYGRPNCEGQGLGETVPPLKRRRKGHLVQQREEPAPGAADPPRRER